ncbi:MAG: thiol reductant ABC exporter subunit CydC [Pseudomonadales bacterium]|nr:thiol reductant ABC exporter subunit CydC [Pseudomonadales bacterium]
MKNFYRLLTLSRPHLRWMLLGGILALITVLANIALLTVSGWFIASMAVAGVTGVMMNYFTPAGIIRFLAIIRTGGRYAERYVTHDITFKFLSELRVWFYRRLEPLAPAHLQGMHSSDLLSRLQADVGRLDDFYLRILVPVFVAVIAGPIVVIVAWFYSTDLSIILMIGLLAAGMVLPAWIIQSNRNYAEQSVKASAALRTSIIDGLQGMRELIVYQAAQAQIDKTAQLNQFLLAKQDRLNKTSASAQGVSLLLINLTVWAALWLLIPQVVSGDRANTELAMLTLLVLASFEVVVPLALTFEQMPIVAASLSRILCMADMPPTRIEPVDGSPEPIDGSICLEQIQFSYNLNEGPVLKDISLEIKSGDHVAIVGASGAGKSSIAHLLLGFWQADTGCITIAGHAIECYTESDLRKQFSVVSQHSYLFSATIRDNLMLANPDADQAMLDRACATAGLTDFINELVDGYDTWLGQSGVGLSGGQARRLAIAQALLKPGQILILDEPTEGLDFKTEQQVLQAIFELMKDRTVVLITHNPRMLKKMDWIYLIEDGRIVGQGSHQQLIKADALYSNQLRLF